MRWICVTLVACAVGISAGWSAHTLFGNSSKPAASRSYALVKVVSARIGASLPVTVSAEWHTAPLLYNLSAGTVTSIAIHSGSVLNAGDILYTVDLQPVVVARGSIPAFETMRKGVSGLDVKQLQLFLKDEGFYSGITDGSFGEATERAVRAWQHSIGATVSGVVTAGSLLFSDALPARVAVDTSTLKVGNNVSGHEEVIRRLDNSPTFAINLPETQAQTITVGSDITITGPQGQTWRGKTSTSTVSNSGNTSVRIASTTTSPLCKNKCTTLNTNHSTQLSGSIVTVPTAAGLSVPTSAIVSDSNGQTAVITSRGRLRHVRIVATANGVDIVTGLTKGEDVRLPKIDQ